MVMEYNEYEDEDRPIQEESAEDWRDSDVDTSGDDEPTQIVDITGREDPEWDGEVVEEGDHVHDWDIERDEKYYDNTLVDEPDPVYYPPQQQPTQQGVDPRIAESLWRENQQHKQQQVTQFFQNAAYRYAQHLINNEGLPPEQAARVAMSEAASTYQQMRQESQQYQTLLGYEQQAKAYTAQYFGQQFGVDPQELMGYDTLQGMYRAAEGLGRREATARYHAQQAQQAMRSRVPVQNYNSTGRGGGYASEEALLDRYIQGDTSKEVMAAVRRNGIR